MPEHKHTPAPWRDGNTVDSIVADLPAGVEPDDNSQFYGGLVVAESVSSNNKPLIKAAPDLLRLFRKLAEKLPKDLALPSGACEVLAELRTVADAAEGKPVSVIGDEDEDEDDADAMEVNW